MTTIQEILDDLANFAVDDDPTYIADFLTAKGIKSPYHFTSYDCPLALWIERQTNKHVFVYRTDWNEEHFNVHYENAKYKCADVVDAFISAFDAEQYPALRGEA